MERLCDDLYAILEASSMASCEELKANYRRLILQYHPDKVSAGKRELSRVEFHRLDQAWKILSDPTLRHQYDTKQRADRLINTLVNDEIELDEMAYDEDDQSYFHPCRCGGDYIFAQAEASSSGPSIVNCSNCSLCIQILVEHSSNETKETSDGHKGTNDDELDGELDENTQKVGSNVPSERTSDETTVRFDCDGNAKNEEFDETCSKIRTNGLLNQPINNTNVNFDFDNAAINEELDETSQVRHLIK